ncbi:MAG: protein kinase domain-containing protein [Planctomycetota bacterium]
MTEPQWEQLKGIVADALEREPARRAAFLDSACGGDVELRHQAEALLEIEDDADTYFEVRTQPGAPAQKTDEASKTIGRYTTRRVIATGGMGTIYEAEQDHPSRLVALKVLRHGAASSTALRRFRHEAEILGRLRHPNIAQIHDAGTFDEGAGVQPYFAMELVKGRPLIEYCESTGLGTRDRLRLFTKVCNAVQYAHHQGVIHRDLKPDNILVDDFGEPKVLDFGVARATDSDIQLTTVRTDIGQLIGTVPYMSPEQVTGDPTNVDTRSDVYSLGVVLYELLCGQLPHDLRGRSIPDAVRVIQESDPRPLSSISRVYRGDVETIVFKALEKEKERRYQTAAELTADIGHYLADEPIVARPASTLYQLRKFARRNRTLVGGVAAVMLVLVVGTVVALVLAIRASNEAAKATAVSKYLMKMFADLGPGDQIFGIGVPDPRGAVTEVTELADRAAERLEADLSEWPDVMAAFQYQLGVTYYGLGNDSGRRRHFSEAYELRAELLGESHPDTLIARLWVADELRRDLKFAAAELEFQEVADRLREACGEADPRTLVANNRLAEVLVENGKPQQAEQLHRKTIALIRAQGGDSSRLMFMTLGSFGGHVLVLLGKYEEAEKILRKGWETGRQVLPHEDRALVRFEGLIVGMLAAQNKRDEADAAWREFTDDPLTTTEHLAAVLSNESTLGERLQLPGIKKYAEAELVLRDALARQRLVLEADHPNTLLTLHRLGILLNQRGRPSEAEPFLRAAAEGQEKVLGEDDPYTLGSLLGLARSLRIQGKHDEAETHFRRRLDVLQRTYGPDHPLTIQATNELARLQLKMQRESP